MTSQIIQQQLTDVVAPPAAGEQICQICATAVVKPRVGFAPAWLTPLE